MKTIDKIKVLCDSRGMKISALEKELGWGNNALTKPKSLPFDRIVVLSRYFEQPLDFFIDDEMEEITIKRQIVFTKDRTFNEYVEMLWGLPESRKKSIYDQIRFQRFEVEEEKKDDVQVSAS